ncbi:MAG: radical SAM protein [Opitutaceae bacterium]|nr:radical SAM protein [Opitutaceae bacterium]
MRYVFGPVPSRRLGRSLGIDTVPSKTCNWNCVYCQLGRTHPLTNARKDFFPVERILAEVRARLAALRSDSIDWITFVASGEGTLHRGTGDLIREVKRLSDHPVAVITNGSLLHLAEVRAELAAADAVLPTLDTGDADLFRRLNRPHRCLTFEQHVAGIAAFARLRSRGRLWIEVMLVAGLNDSEPALRRLAAVLEHIGPDEIHLILPSRCPVEPWVRPPDTDGLRCAQAILGAKASLTPPPAMPAATVHAAPADPDLVAIVTRHPLRRADLASVFAGWPAARINALVADLLAAGRIQVVARFGEPFIVAAGLRYPKENAVIDNKIGA